MKMQIVTCPRCGTYLFDDTAECHGCGHVVGQRSTTTLKSRPLPTDNAVQDDMQACPSCGETCRTGLVRCWSCSAFLRPEIEASYKKMRESGRYEVEHVELQILDATTVTEEDSLKRRVSTPESYLASHPYAKEDFGGGDDFELSGEAQFGEDDDETFDLSDNLRLAEQSESESESSDLETFRLQASSVMSPESAESTTDIEPPIRTDLSEPPVREDLSEPPVRADSSEPPVRSEAVEAKAEPEAPAKPEGDELLKIAADEEQDIQRVRKSLRSKDSFVIFCPQGCRIRVKEKHRGKSGKCPRCQSEFVVPRKPVPKKADADAQTPAEPVIVSRYKKWLDNVRLHTVDPQKLRIKADSLLNECQAVDLGFSEDGLLVVSLFAGKFTAANPKKIQPLRQAMIEHFLKGGTLEALTAVAKKEYSNELLAQLTVAQPAPAGTESLFGDIPVFGTNRIAVRIPKLSDDTHPKYLSLCLSEFRAFAEGLQTVLGIEGFGANTDIPLTDEYATLKCHLSQAPVLELAKLNYYQKDPGYKLEVSGWRCAGCGIVISEAARAEAKLGGANGKSLAKTKCPKCTQKFGNLPLNQLVGAADPKPAPEPEASAT